MRNECHQILLDCKKKKIKKIYLSGQSELTEVLILKAKELDVAFEGLFIFGTNKSTVFYSGNIVRIRTSKKAIGTYFVIEWY